MAVTSTDALDAMPVIRNAAQFDRRSGNILERLVFNNRVAMVIACANPTVLRLFEITKLDSTFDIVPDRDAAVARIRQAIAD